MVWRRTQPAVESVKVVEEVRWTTGKQQNRICCTAELRLGAKSTNMSYLHHLWTGSIPVTGRRGWAHRQTDRQTSTCCLALHQVTITANDISGTPTIDTIIHLHFGVCCSWYSCFTFWWYQVPNLTGYYASFLSFLVFPGTSRDSR
jgi:hypothetical protein